jgi:hypothetical protein
MWYTRKVEDLCIWIYVVIFDIIAMITIFYTVVLSVIQGVALNTGVLPFSKGRALDPLDTMMPPDAARERPVTRRTQQKHQIFS